MRRRLRQLWRSIGPTSNIEIGASSRIKRWRVSLDEAAKLMVGENSIVDARIISDRPGVQFMVGNRTSLGNSLLVGASRIEIGDDVLMSWGVTVVDHDSHSLDWAHRHQDVMDWRRGVKNWDHVTIAPVKICDKVWIGFGAIILKGVTINEGAVIAAGTVVTKNIPPWTLVAGNPAKVVRSLEPFSDQQP